MDKNDLNDLKSDDRLKLKALYNRFRDGFFGYGKKRFNLDEQELADIYQVSFLALRKRAVEGKLDEIKAGMKTYLFSIGRNKIIDFLSKNGRNISLDPETHLEGEEDINQHLDDTKPLNLHQELLQRCFGKLGEKCQQVLTMYYYRGLSIKDIVELAGYKNENTVKSLKSRCITNLRDCMENR